MLDDNECPVCFEKKPLYYLHGNIHKFCMECNKKLHICPLCRVVVKNRKIYIGLIQLKSFNFDDNFIEKIKDKYLPFVYEHGTDEGSKFINMLKELYKSNIY